MKIVALILALFVAFPNMGYALASNCCSHEKVADQACGQDDMADTDHESDNTPCSSQCDCSCCQATFLISEEINYKEKAIASLINTTPLNGGTPFAKGITDLIWQPPKLG